jgi:uncharacterized protein (DUF2141 family)
MTRMRLLTQSIVAGALLTIAVVASPAKVLAQSKNGIAVRVDGMKNDDGRLLCSLFNGPDGFPRDAHKQFRGAHVSIHGGTGICEFDNVPAGTYAATVLHDTNSNGKMDFNKVGMPKKGFGFSNDAKVTMLPPAPPSFKAASFSYSGSGMLTVPIRIVNPKF